MVNNFIDPQAEDRELKVQLLRKYSGYIGSLKQEFMKKKKNGKLPKEARQQLLDWWSRHYKWPYPSVSLITVKLMDTHTYVYLYTKMLILLVYGYGNIDIYVVCDFIYAGGTEASTCRVYRIGSETDKQLVHKSEKTPLEAFGGYAIYGDGCSSSSSSSILLYGQYDVQSFSHGLLILTALIYFLIIIILIRP